MWNRHIHTSTQNVYNVHNATIDNIGILRHKTHLRLLSSGTKLYYLWVKRFFNIRREIPSFYADFSICPKPHAHPHKASVSKQKSTFFFDGKTQLTDFSQIPPNPPCTLPVLDVIRTPSLVSHLGFLLWHLWMTRLLRVRCEHLPSCLHLTNPCTEPKGSQPN